MLLCKRSLSAKAVSFGINYRHTRRNRFWKYKYRLLYGWRLLELMISFVRAFILSIKPRHADSILWPYSINQMLFSIHPYFILVCLFYKRFMPIVYVYVLFIYCIFYSVTRHNGRTVWLNGPLCINIFEMENLKKDWNNSMKENKIRSFVS